jgi:DNA-binding IclR family transcriptional regulator
MWYSVPEHRTTFDDGMPQVSYEKSGVKVVEQAMSVLQVLGESTESKGVRELAAMLSMSVTTTQRILVSLERTKMIIQEQSTGKYTLGPALLQLSARYLAGTPIFTHIARSVEAVWREAQETVIVATLIDGARVPIYQMESPHPLRFVAQVGRKYHLHGGALGHAILASLDPDIAEAEMRSIDYPMITSHTPTSIDQLRERVAQVRQQGYAISIAEQVPDSAGVAVPVGSSNARGLSLGLFTPEARMTEENIRRFIEILKPEAEVLYASLAPWLSRSDGHDLDPMSYVTSDAS